MAATPPDPLATTGKYDAFISYSHAADAALAPALQRALHAFAKPWYRLRSLHVFRDETSLAANPALWPSIERALAASRWFIYLASPRAAASHWVQREVDWWLQHRGAASMLIVLTDGALRWDDSAGDFDWAATDVLPPVLAGRFTAEPLWVDLTWAARPEVRTLRHGPFRAAVLRLASPLHGRDPEELDGDDLRVFRRNRTIARAGIAALAVLTIASVTAAVIAISRSRESTSRELAMYSVQQLEADPELSLRLAMYAMDNASTQQAEEALRRALGESQVLATVQLGGQVTEAAYSGSGRRVLLASGQDVWLFGSEEPIRLAHPALVWSAEFSRDETLVATGGWDGKARIWNASNGMQLAELPVGVAKSDGPGDSWIVGEARFSADGARLVTRGGPPGSDDAEEAKVWDVRTGRLLATVDHTAPVDAVALSPDGVKVSTAGWDSTVRVWHATTGALERTLAGHVGTIEVLRYSPDGRWLLSGSRDLTVRKWDARSGALVGVSGRATSEAGLPAQTRLVVISDSTARALVHDDTVTALYDTGTGTLLRTLTDFPGTCQAASFSPDDHLVACPGSDGGAFVWNADTGRRIATLRGHKGDLNGIAIRPDNQDVLTAGTDGTARRWTLTPIAFDVILAGHTSSVDTAAWSPDGELVATAAYDGTARVWDARTGAAVTVVTPKTAAGSPARVAFVSFATDGRRLLVGSHDAGADIWDARSGSLVQRLERVNAGARDEHLIEVAWGPADALLVGVVDSAKHADTAPAGTSQVEEFFRGYRVFRWDAATGGLMPDPPALMPLSKSPQADCAYSRPSGFFCLRIGDGLPVHIWDVRSGAELAKVTPTEEFVSHGAMTDDGALLALSGFKTVEIWQARTGQKQAEMAPGDEQYVTDVAFDAAGRQVITAGGQATPVARIWDALSGRLVRELRGHTHGLTMSRFSPDGRLAVTASQDTTARVWRVSDGQAIATIRGHRDTVMGAWFSPDGQRVLTASADGTARVFNMSLSGSAANLLELAGRRETRELTAQERERFLH